MSEYRVIIEKKEGEITEGPWKNGSLKLAELSLAAVKMYADLSGKKMHKVSFETR